MINFFMRCVFALALVLFFTTPFTTYAALTDPQVQSVLSLLNSFGVENSVADNVRQSLTGSVLGAISPAENQYPSYCPTITRILERGSRDATTGGQVTELQKFISGYYDINPAEIVTGYFGPLTYEKVLRFQTEQGITRTGAVGLLTRARIAEVCVDPVVTSPTLSIATDASSPQFALVAAQTTVPLVVAKLHAGQATALQNLSLTLTRGSSLDLEKVSVYQGDTLLGDVYFVGTQTKTTLLLPAPVDISGNADVLLTVRGTLARIGTGQAVSESGHLVAVDITGAKAMDMLTGASIAVQGTTQSAGVRVLKSVPTVALIPLPATGAEDNRLLRFSVTAAPQGDLSLVRLNIGVETSGTILNAIDLHGWTDSNFSIAMSGYPGGHLASQIFSGVTQGVMVYGGGSVTIPAGQTRYFEARSGVSNIQPGGTIRTTLKGDATDFGVIMLSAQEAQGSKFIWSPHSTTFPSSAIPDFANGYAVSGLPSAGLVSVRSYSGTGTTTSPQPPVATTTQPQVAPAITSFTATPSALTTGQYTTLAWSSTGTTNGGCYIFAGPVATTNGMSITPSYLWVGNGSFAVTPSATTVYTLWCTGSWKDGGQSTQRSITVSVSAPVSGVTTPRPGPSPTTNPGSGVLQ